jgi:hypothetical protein
MKNLHKKYLLLFVFSCLLSKAQIFTYKQKRDWVVGHYVGYSKDSTANGPWVANSWDIKYSSDFDVLDDSTVSIFGYKQHVIGDDSVFLFPTGQLVVGNSGKVYADSTMEYWDVFPAGAMMTAHLFWFKGKLVQSYVGLKNKLKESLTINVYPSPSPDYINVSFSNNQFIKQLTWNITDINGKQILNGPLITPSLKINTIEFMDGVYFLNINSKEGVIYKKFVVQH